MSGINSEYFSMSGANLKILKSVECEVKCDGECRANSCQCQRLIFF